jgi:hypothetical protein
MNAMESNKLSKSFGVRVPLDLYMQMIKVSTENKLTMTDLVLYSIMNSGIPKGQISFKDGGEALGKYVHQIERLERQISEMDKRYKSLIEEFKEQVGMNDVFATENQSLSIQNKRLEERNNKLFLENKKLSEQHKHWEMYGHAKRHENK